MLNTESFSQEHEGIKLCPDEKEVVIPVLEEFVFVDKKRIETATVTVIKKISESTKIVDLMLQSEAYEIEHRACHQYVDENDMPATRQEGDTLIFPVLKEVMVKRTLLLEEIRITKKITQAAEPQYITLRAETIEVKREPVTEK